MTDDDDNDTAATFARLEAEYEDRENARLTAWIDECLQTHRWDGGYFCRCGRALNSPNGWGRHLLAVALEVPE